MGEAQQFLEKSLDFKVTPSLTNSASTGQRAIEGGLGFIKSLWQKATGRGNSVPESPVSLPSEPEAKRQRVDPSVPALADAPLAAKNNARSPGQENTGTSAVATLRGALPSSSHGKDSSEAELQPELQQLLSEMNARAQGSVLQLEYPAAAPSPQDVEHAAQRARAAAEVERILSSRSAVEVLGRGSKDEQKQEFKRLALLLHPDKGFVDADDERAGLAMRLAMAALNRSRQGA